MNLLLVFLAATSFGSAQSHRPKITDQAAARAIRLLPSVKPGTALDELWKKLGLGKFAEPERGRGRGPREHYDLNFELNRWYRVSLVLDYS